MLLSVQLDWKMDYIFHSRIRYQCGLVMTRDLFNRSYIKYIAVFILFIKYMILF